MIKSKFWTCDASWVFNPSITSMGIWALALSSFVFLYYSLFTVCVCVFVVKKKINRYWPSRWENTWNHWKTPLDQRRREWLIKLLSSAFLEQCFGFSPPLFFFTLGLVSLFCWVAFMEAIGLSIPRGWKEYWDSWEGEMGRPISLCFW